MQRSDFLFEMTAHAPKYLNHLIVLLIVPFLFFLLLSRTTIGERLEYKGYDLLFYLRGSLPQPDDIIVVAIDNPSFQQLGYQWPWPRTVHADLIMAMKRAGARCVVYDVLFSEATDPAQDSALAKALRAHGTVILASTIEVSENPLTRHVIHVEPVSYFKEAALDVGLANLPVDNDGFVRRGYLTYHGRKSLAGKVLEHCAPRVEKDAKESFPWTSTENSVSLLINFHGGSRQGIRTVSFYQALEHETMLPDDVFKDKIVLVGLSQSSTFDSTSMQTDAFLTPFFSQLKSPMAGVEIHAHLVNTLLDGTWIRVPESGLIAVATLGLLVISGLGILRMRVRTAFLVSVGLAVLYFLAVLALFDLERTAFPWITPLVALFLMAAENGVYRYVLAERERRRIKGAFQNYVDPSVVRQILRDPSRLRLGGEETEGTILFTDLAGFTGIAERLRPSELVSFFNEYFSEMVDILFRFHGTLDKFIGDAIMAFWGIPVASADHAREACLCAVSMQGKMGELNERFRMRGLPRLEMRIGINSGRVIAGNMGSKNLFNYTVMGDTVNLASRLESANRFYGTRSIIGEATWLMVKDELVTRELDILVVKGRHEGVRIFELIGTISDSSSSASAMIEAFHTGLAEYRRRRWEHAIECFEKALHINPDDSPSKMYVARCKECMVRPPPAGWKGEMKADEK